MPPRYAPLFALVLLSWAGCAPEGSWSVQDVSPAAERGQQVLSLRRHTAGVTAVAFSPDALSVLTASSDQTALIWRAVPFQAASPAASAK